MLENNKVDYSNYNARVNGAYPEIWLNTGKCVFCDLRDKYIIAEVGNVVLTVALFPYVDGHLLIIPRRHFESYGGMYRKEWMAMCKLAMLGESVLKKRGFGEKDGFVFLYRMGAGFCADKSVAHAHAHIFPYSSKVYTVNFQKIDIPPVNLAKDLREIRKEIEGVS